MICAATDGRRIFRTGRSPSLRDRSARQYQATYLGTKGSSIGNGLVYWTANPSFLVWALSAPVQLAGGVAAGIQSPYPGFAGSVAQADAYPHAIGVESQQSRRQLRITRCRRRSACGAGAGPTCRWPIPGRSRFPTPTSGGRRPSERATYNRRLEKAITTDVPHVFALSYSYDAVRRGKAMLNSKGAAAKCSAAGSSRVFIIFGRRAHQLSANNTLPLFTSVLRPNAVANTNRRVDASNFDPAVDFWM